jgi:hypothetical protein
MKSNLKKAYSLSIVLVFTLLFFNNITAQEDKRKTADKLSQQIVITWNKNTPEQEMNDDVKALKEKGITIKYSNLKRNDKDEIVSIKIEYADNEGNSGATEYNGKNPINVIKFYKNHDSIGFGEPSDMSFDFADFDLNSDKKFDDLKNKIEKDSLNYGKFDFKFPHSKKSFFSSDSKIIIKKEGKKPLTIINGKIVEGGDDYTAEELEKIKKENQFSSKEGLTDNFGFSNKEFDFFADGSFQDLRLQVEKMQQQMEEMFKKQGDNIEQKPLEKNNKKEEAKKLKKSNNSESNDEKSNKKFQKI